MGMRVLIFGSVEVSQKLIQILQDDEIKIVGRTSDENAVLDEISKLKINVLLIASDNINKTTRVSQQVYLLRPRTIPIVLTDNYTGEILQQIIQTGVNNILPLQLDSAMLIAKIKSIYSNESSRMQALENTNNSNWKSQVITVFSAKGGVGKSTFITNLAIALANRKRRVCILDYDMEFGEIASLYNISPSNSIVELLEEQNSLNINGIRKYLNMHMSGVEILASPPSPEYADNISANNVEKIISIIRNQYDYILIDTKVGFTPVNLSTFDLSSMVIFVTGMDLSSLRKSKKGLSILYSLVPREKVKLVVANEEPSRVKIKDISRALETEIWASIPHDQKAAMEAINLGIPMVQGNSSAKVSKAYNRLVEIIDGKNPAGGRGKEKSASKFNFFNIKNNKAKSKKSKPRKGR